MRRISVLSAVMCLGSNMGCGCPSGPKGDGGITGDGGSGAYADAGESVLMHHKTPDRRGMYIQPALTHAAVTGNGADGGLNRDPAFVASLPDPNDMVYAQPLYLDRGSAGPDLVIVATEANNVYALDANTGAQLWKQNVGTPVPLAIMSCGNIDPFGITGTPVIDPATQTLYFDALVLVGGKPAHQVFALATDTGAIQSGWPVDVTSVAKPTFTSKAQGERGALALIGGTVFIPFGGLYGDCAPYHGRVLGISVSDPSQVQNWATGAGAGGVWAVSGIASDGQTLFVTTGNTQGATTWAGGEAVVQLVPGSFNTNSYWAPKNWLSLDNGDVDLGGTGPILFDLPGSTPGQLVLALGKDGNAYVLDRTSLGGVSAPVASNSVASNEIINAAAVYTTTTATYAVFRGAGTLCTRGAGGDLTAIKILPGAPPTIAGSWCASAGSGSPMVTTSDGHSDPIVWDTGAESDNLLHAFDGDTGAPINFPGGSVVISNMRRFNTPIAAKGRIFVAADNAVVAFKL